MADNYCTFRNGRICLPVKKDYKFKISGSIIDKYSTGSTLFIEPSGAAKYYEELQLLKISEENEVYHILYTLSAFVLASVPVLYENLAMIEKLDFIFSKGKLSLDMEATEPTINTERRMKLREPRHPLMDKTVAIKTIMLNCIMAQCGLHVTCKQADICMNSSYLCDIGDGQNLERAVLFFGYNTLSGNKRIRC